MQIQYTNQGDTYSFSLWHSVYKWMIPRMGYILNFLYYGAIMALIAITLISGLYVMVPPFQGIMDNTKLGDIFVNKSIREALASGDEDESKVLFKHVIIKNVLLIIVLMGIRFTVTRFL